MKQVKPASRSSASAWISVTGGVVLAALLAPNANAQEAPAGDQPAPTIEVEPVTPPTPIAPAEIDPTEEATDPAPAPAPATEPPPGETTVPTPAEAAGAAEPPAEEAPAAKGTVGVKGRVIDAETNAPITDATVEVVKGGQGSTVTDANGEYMLDLAPGKYELRVASDLYQGIRVRGVVVKRGGIFKFDAKLFPDPGAVEQIVVIGKPDPRTESAGLEKRKRSAKVEDTISAQEIARSPDSNAGDAVKRVVSATIVDGKYVYIRGLGGRYSIALLNGVPLPSPDPDNPAVPLDLFPASLLANLTVVKSYSADLPGTFAGGALLIETNTYPENFELKLKLSGGYDSASTFKDMHTYAGGSTDWLGFDDGTRALPDSVPRDRPLTGQGSMTTREENAAIARDFDNNWTVYDETARPNFSLSAQLGDTVRAGGKKVGYLGSVQYGQKFQVRQFDNQRARLDNDVIVGRDPADITRGEQTVSWGALGNVGVEMNANHSLSLLTLFSRAADDRAFLDEGNVDNTDYQKSRLQYSVRQLSFTQLAGSHRFPGAGALELRWQANYALTSRDEPDTRDMFYQFTPADDGSGNLVRYFIETPLSGERQYNELSDVSGGGGVDFTLPFDNGSFKLGATAQDSTRNSDARRIGYKSAPNASGQAKALGPDEIFDPSRMGTDWLLTERTQADDGYEASRLITSVYAIGDYKIIEPLRLILGVRFEHGEQSLAAGSSILTATMDDAVDRSDDDWLPSAAVVYSLTSKMNLRASGSRTLARPQFRELAPFDYYDFTRRRSITGNPHLENTTIDNGDVRWEYFPAERAVFAASAFYKHFTNPIELVTINPSNDGKFLNTGHSIDPNAPVADNDGAVVMGIELEARGNYGLISEALKEFRSAANLTLIDSEVDFGENKGSQTSAKRPLQGQSRYIFNVDLGWLSTDQRFEVTVLYNVFGRRLAEVGISGMPDVYEDSFHRVDFSASAKLPQELKLKIGGTNLFDQDVVVMQGPIVIQTYSPGVALTASLEWAPK